MRPGLRAAILCSLASILLVAGCQEVATESDAPAGPDTPDAPPAGAPNTPPTISGTPVQSITVGATYSFQAIASDSDVDPLSFSVAGLPAWASFDPQRGLISGTPAATHAGSTAEITITVSDGRAIASLAPFEIVINPIPALLPPIPASNQAPAISGAPAAQAQTALTYRFQPVVMDSDSSTVTFSIVNKPRWASFSAVTGELTGTPTAAQAGTYENIVITASDGALSVALPPFSVSVTTGANSPPILTGTQPTAATVGVAYNFMPTASDPDGETLTFSAINLPAWATLVPSTGQLHGVPSMSHIGTHNGIVLRVSDGRNTMSLPAFAITVSPPPNQLPTISGVPGTSVAAGNAYAFAPSASDADGQTLTFSIANRPSWASFNSVTGALSGAPNGAQLGTYSNIVISVSDGIASASLPAFTITVLPAPNQLPVISGAPATSVTAGNAYSFAPVASDADGQPLTFSIANRPSWASFNTTNGTLAGAPIAAFVGTYGSIVISVSDGLTTVSLPAFSITVSAAPNQAPTISGTPATSVTAGNAYVFVPSASDADADPLTFSIANQPAWGSFNPSTGALTGTPSGAQVGTSGNILISVSDGKVTTSLPAFAITVDAAPNTPPTIGGAPSTGVTAGSPYLFQPSGFDADGENLTYAITNLPVWASFNASTGALTGTPTGAHIGTYGGVTISVSDGVATTSLAPFSITVSAVPNTAPVLNGSPGTTVTTGNAYSFIPTASDADADPLTFSIANGPSWASFNTSTGALTGTPALAHAGVYHNIVISVSDGTASASLPGFSITVSAPPNNAPVIGGTPGGSVTAGNAYSFTPSASDADTDPLTFSIANKPGWASFNTSTGTLTGTPNGAQAGVFGSIVITVSDGTASASLPAFSITVNTPPNNAPVIGGTPGPTVTAGNAYSFTPSASDADADLLTFSIANLPSWASFNTSTGALTGTPSLAHAGVYNSIVISVSDGTDSTSLPIFSISVSAPPNNAPTIGGVPATSVTAANAYSFTPSASDADADTLTFTIANRPSWASFNTTTGALTGTPALAHAGVYSTIVISVSDGTASASLPAFSITVSAPPNNAPTIGGAAAASVTAGNAYSFVPAAADADADTLTFSIANRPAWATFNVSTGALTGTPDGAQVGTYSGIVITVSDGQATTSLPAFAITVNAAPNNAPIIAGSPATSITSGNAYSFTPVASDSDGQNLTFSIANRPAWASFDINTGALAGTPSLAHAGTYSGIVISVTDGVATSALPPFSIIVSAPPNNAPTISGLPAASVTAGSAYSFAPAASDADAGDTLGFTIVGKPSWATFNTATGALTGTPANSAAGVYSSIQISVSDGQASVSLASFSITVVPNGTATLSWSAPTQNSDDSALTNLEGYYVYQGSSPASLSRVATIANPAATSTVIGNLAPGTYYFAVSAYTTAGVESPLSTVGSKTIP